MSTLAVDTWHIINIWTENLTEVPNWFLPLNSGTTYETNENSSTKFEKSEKSGTNKIFNPNIYIYLMFNIIHYWKKIINTIGVLDTSPNMNNMMMYVLKVTFFFIRIKLLDNSTWFWYFSDDVSHSHIAGLSGLINSFTIKFRVGIGSVGVNRGVFDNWTTEVD